MNQQHQQSKKAAAGMFLQDACTSLTQNLQMQSINCYQHLSSQLIDQIVEIEMKRLKANCNREEVHYVEQMLLENPIVVERRTTPIAAAAVETKTNVYNHTIKAPRGGEGQGDGDREDDETLLPQQQRTDSCRRSRLNNKIKKAKSKYRHKFMSNKLMQSANMLECIQKLIVQTETQLINQGFSGMQLQILRNSFYNDV